MAEPLPTIRPLPPTAADLCDRHAAPPRLVRHLALVHDAAAEVLAALSRSLPGLKVDADAVRLGSATHDLDKALHPDELTGPGDLHGRDGPALLEAHGLPPAVARFARTHGSWRRGEAVELEDLLVAAADLAWRGGRDDDLDRRSAESLGGAGEAGGVGGVRGGGRGVACRRNRRRGAAAVGGRRLTALQGADAAVSSGPMLDDLPTLILRHADDEAALRAATARHVGAVRATIGRRDRGVVVRAETDVRRDPAAAFSFDASGRATLTAAGRTWDAGRFATPTLAELRERAEAKAGGGRVRLWVLDGASPATDVAAMQAFAAPGTLFQVASQFNCLEAPGPGVVPVAAYLYDPTQGPRAAVSCFPAALLRHHAAPREGGRFVQQDGGPQLDLLAEAVGPGVVRGGYLTGEGVDPNRLAADLAANFELVRVGVHEGAEVALGHNWDGDVPTPAPRVAQVLSSTVAGGGYGGREHLGGRFEDCCGHLLRAAYLGTLLAAVVAGCGRVVLTLVGGGVFANPRPLIAEAIAWAVGQVPARAGGLEVFVNGHGLGTATADALLAAARPTGGYLLRLDGGGVADLRR